MMKNLVFALAVSLELNYISASAINSRSNSKSLCGVSGYDQGTESFYGSSDGSYAACSAKCLQYSTCNMFVVGAGECQLYDTTVKQNWVQVSDSQYTVYDRACMSTSSTTSAPTTTDVGTTTSARVTTTKTSVTTTTNAVKKTTTSTTSAKPTSTTSTIVSKITSSMKTSTTSTTTTVASTAAEITSSTSTSVQDPAAASTTSTQAGPPLICGVQGHYMKGAVGIGSYDSNYGEMTQEALTECYNYCQSAYSCVAWTWLPYGCQQWHSGTQFFQATTSWQYYIWDRNCPAPVMSDSVSTTTTSTTTAISTTQPATVCTRR